MDLAGTAKVSMNSTASFPSLNIPKQTFYRNIHQEPYIVNRYVRPKGLPVHKYEVIQSQKEIEF